jgi:hypothetical protein
MSQTGNFFIKQIIKSNCSPQKVISICDQLVESGLNNRAYFKALELSNAHGKTDISNLILKRIQRQKKMLRPSSFWPLLVNQAFTCFAYHQVKKNFWCFFYLSFLDRTV